MPCLPNFRAFLRPETEVQELQLQQVFQVPWGKRKNPPGPWKFEGLEFFPGFWSPKFSLEFFFGFCSSSYLFLV